MTDQKPDDKEQSKRFIDKAKELGCDESDERFDATLKNLVRKKDVNQTEQA